MLYKTSLEGSVEYLFLMLNKCLYAFVLKLAHGAGTEINNLLILIGHPVLFQPTKNMSPGIVIEEAKQQVACLVKRQNAELVRVLNVHDLITDVIGSLHEKHQRMARIR